MKNDLKNQRLIIVAVTLLWSMFYTSSVMPTTTMEDGMSSSMPDDGGGDSSSDGDGSVMPTSTMDGDAMSSSMSDGGGDSSSDGGGGMMPTTTMDDDDMTSSMSDGGDDGDSSDGGVMPTSTMDAGMMSAGMMENTTTSTTTPTPTTNPATVKTNVPIKFTMKRDFKKELANKSSEEYKARKEEVVDAVNKTLSKNPRYSHIADVTFSNGSIVTVLDAVFHFPVSTAKDAPTDSTEFDHDLTESLIEAINNGSLQGLNIDNSTLDVAPPVNCPESTILVQVENSEIGECQNSGSTQINPIKLSTVAVTTLATIIILFVDEI